MFDLVECAPGVEHLALIEEGEDLLEQAPETG